MRKETIKKMTVMAMLAALSMVLVYAIHVPLIPVVPFLEYDPADIPILIAAMAYGPVSGLVLTVVVSIIQGMFISTTGPWGILMHVIATGTLVLVAGGIYRLRHTRAGAVLGLVFGTLAMGLVMVPANHFITPVWMGAPTEVVDSLMLVGILPFNLLKAGINSAVTFVVYKVVSRYLVHGGPIRGHSRQIVRRCIRHLKNLKKIPGRFRFPGIFNMSKGTAEVAPPSANNQYPVSATTYRHGEVHSGQLPEEILACASLRLPLLFKIKRRFGRAPIRKRLSAVSP